MNISIISGSHRKQGQSGRIAAYLKKILLQESLCADCTIISLADNPLPLWDSGVWEGDPDWRSRLQPLKETLTASDGLVVVSPEWHGMVPAGLKNFFLFCSARELGHKPALITAVSAGQGGAYPVTELRQSSYKNNRLCYIPEHLIIRNAENVLHDESHKNTVDDSWLRERILYALSLLIEYARALKHVRHSGIVDHDRFKNGL